MVAARSRGRVPFRVVIVGAGKVGSALARALRHAGASVALRRARDLQEVKRPRPLDADLLILAVRDAQLGPLAERLASGWVTKKTAVVHCAGALGPEPLAPLRGVSAGVAQMHPMISFASRANVPSLERGHVHVDGDPIAVRRATKVARLLGMSPRTIAGLDRVLYHAAAGLVANGGAALAAAGAQILATAGVDAETAARMLGPLLRSVADNIEALGLPGALTGPVRRGESASVLRHLATLRARTPELVPLYLALAAAQVPLARQVGDAPAAVFDELEAALAAEQTRGR